MFLVTFVNIFIYLIHFKLCFINRAQEEHVQLINRIGVNSAINDKRYCIKAFSSFSVI